MSGCPKCGGDNIALYDSIDFEMDFESNTLWEKRVVSCIDCGHEFGQKITADIVNIKVETY